MAAERDDDSPDAVQEPLLRSEGRDNDNGDEAGSEGEDVSDGLDEHEIKDVGWFIYLLTFAAGVSGLLFGYDTGVISSTLVSIGTDLQRPLTTLDKSLITSSTSLFALIASPTAGLLSDSLGRRPVIVLSCILFVAGALIQAFSTTVLLMILGRSVVGLAVGSASFVVPLYISELAPSHTRGRLVTINQLFITGGQVVAYVVGWGLSGIPSGWRWMVGLGGLPAAIQLVLLVKMPETPRWLVRAGRPERARTVLKSVYGEANEALAQAVLKRVQIEIREEEEAESYRRIHARQQQSKLQSLARFGKLGEGIVELWSVGGNKRALAIACMLQGFQQLCGFNSLMYFSATIFALLGFHSPTLASLSIACTNFIFTLVAFAVIDRLGRRRILLSSIPVMVGGLVLCSVAFGFMGVPSSHEEGMRALLLRRVTAPESGGGIWPLIILLAMVIYVAGYAIGMGCVPWQQSELFPLSVRSLGAALATATNWGANFIVGLTFLPLMDGLTPPGTFALYAAVCVAAWFTVWRIYPETAGLSLEEVGGLLRDGWGVSESRRRR